MLAKYQNGNTLVELHEDGTKIRTTPDDERPSPLYPESIDLKITNYCDMGCQMCHEMSTKLGQHADLLDISRYLIDEVQHAGMELAIGGGNPMSHPQFDIFLHNLGQHGFVPNVTMHHRHLQDRNTVLKLKKLQEQGSLYGIGISGGPATYASGVLDNVVYHVIAGYDNPELMAEIKEETGTRKFLVLGYKHKGRGDRYYEKDPNVVDYQLWKWKTRIPLFFEGYDLSFDNLGIEQLDMRRFFDQERWDELYMGNEGSYTMYIDGVNQVYSISSTETETYPLTNIKDDFLNVRTIAGNI